MAENDEAASAPALLGLDDLDTTAGAEEGAVMEVISPDKDGQVLRWPDGRPWSITYYGRDSKRVQKAALAQADRRSAVMFRTRAPQPAQGTENDMIEQLVVATISWDIPLADGSPAKNDAKEYRAAYLKYKWLFDQGSLFVDVRANFLKRAPKTS